MTKPMLKADKLTVGYGNKAVISDIDLTALRGQVVCLLGPNGAGKSTVLKTLSGLLAPVSGEVELDGENIAGLRSDKLSRRLSVVTTEQPSPAMTTVYSLAAMGRTPYTDLFGRLSDEDRRIIDETLELVGIAELRGRYFSELSDGERQKALIARALVQQPEVIVLDEPTSHLDIRYKVEVIRLLQRLSNEKGITCILSLHDIDLAIKGCQTVVLVSGGGIAAVGAPEEIIKSGVIQRLYGISGGEYDELMGSVEFKADIGSDVFVAAGNGTGISIYRALARNGFGVSSGVLHENDIDCETALRICSNVISERAFEPISPHAAEQAKRLALSHKYIVDSGFPVRSGNAENVGLLKALIAAGKTVFSLRDEGESCAIFNELADKIVYLSSISELIEKIKSHNNGGI